MGRRVAGAPFPAEFDSVDWPGDGVVMADPVASGQEQTAGYLCGYATSPESTFG